MRRPDQAKREESVQVPHMISAIAVAVVAAPGAAEVTLYPGPPGEPASQDYEVSVNGQPCFCYTSYRFDLTSEVTIQGRPVSPVSFCYFDADGPTDVEVRMLDGLREAGVDCSRLVVRPLARGIEPEVNGDTARFAVPGGPCQLSVEPGGDVHHPLHIFVNPPERGVPDPKDPGVLYFGPGTHEAAGVDIEDGQTVYIAGGAVVSLKPQPPPNTIAASASAGCYGLDLSWGAGLFAPRWKKHVTVRGRGILCGRNALAQGRRGPLVVFEGCEDVAVEGIIIRESSVWSLNLSNCQRATVSNVKIVGHYVNNDGIAIGGTSDAVVEDCFTHNADDSLEVKAWIPQRNVLFRNCLVWNDAGQSLGLACETEADVENVAFENCTVLHSTDDIASRGVVGLHLVGPGSARAFRFENITIEDVRGPRRPTLKVFNNWDDWHLNYPTKPGSPYELLSPPVRQRPNGSIRNVVFRNVRVLQSRNSDVVLMADGADSPIEGVTFENVAINGEALRPGDPRIKTNAWVRGVEVR
jgi:hypothetical protein